MGLLYLNLQDIKLYGWERRKSRIRIEEFLRALERGLSFPAVPVRKVLDRYILCNDVLDLDPERIDGGHHRALSHYLSGRELACIVLAEQESIPEDFIPIQKIILY